MTSGTQKSRARRVLGVLGSVIGLTVTFSAATVAAVVIHLDAPATRRLVATQVSGILAGTLAGKVEIEHIGGLGLHGVDGVRVRVHDPEGVQVLHVDGVRVRVRALAAARSALFGDGAIVVEVPSASVGNVDANLDADARGEGLRLASAFEPRAPSEPKPAEPPGRGVRVELPEVLLGHAWIHGTPPGAPLVDAELSDLAARAHVDPDVVRAELDRVRLVTRALPRRVDPAGTIGGKFAMPAPNGHGVDVQAVFEGEVAGVPTTIEARMNDRRVDARIDARDPTGARTSSVVDELAIREPLSLHAEAHGDLPHVEGEVSLVVGKATVDAKVVVLASTTTHVKATVAARNVDAGALSEGAPTTNAGLDARADVAIDEDGVHGEASIDTLPGTVDGQPIPRAEVRAKLAGKSAEVRARIHDAAMPTEVAIDVEPRSDVEGQLVKASARARIPDLHRVPMIGAKLGGRAEVDAALRVYLPEKRIEGAQAKVVVSKLREEQLSVGRIEARARMSGTIDRPVIDAELEGRHLLTGTLPLASVDGRARIEIAGSAVTVRDASVKAVRPIDETVEARARLVAIDGAKLRVEGVTVLGVGEPIRADLVKDGREIRGQIDAPRIDLPLAARLSGQEDLEVTKGTLGIRGEGALRGGVAKAKVHVELADLTMRSLDGARAVVDASIDRRDVELAVNAGLGEAGALELRTSGVTIDGRVDDPTAWRRVAGRVHLVSEIDMERAARLLPAEALPVADVRGSFAVRGQVGRDGPDAPPEIQLHAHTNGLAVAGRSSAPERVAGVVVESPPRWRSTDVDVGLDVRNDGKSGLTNVAFRATNAKGVVVALDAKAILPYAEIARTPAVARARALEAPMSVTLVVPPRRLDQLPAGAGVRDVQGAIEARLDASGTVLDPRIRLVARSRGLRTTAMPPDVQADTDVVLDYDGRVAELAAKTRSRGEELLDLGARVEVRARDLIEGDGKTPLAWKAGGRVALHGFPLESVPDLADRHIQGRVSGEVALEGLHEDARVKGRIDLERLAVGKAEYPKGRITLDTGGGKLAARVRLDQKDGFLDASASTGLAWGAEVAPSLDPEHPIEATLKADAFRAAALQPFVEGAVPALDGRIDANARARIVPGRPGAELSGKVAFRDGTVQLAALGEELRSVRATAFFSPDGTIRVTDVFARGTEGEVGADAHVKLDGMRVADAKANIRIPEKRPLALSVQGQPIGELAGAIEIGARQSADAKKTEVVVSVPKLNVALPQVTKTGVQQLESKDNIRVGVFRDRDKFVMLPLSKADAARAAGEDEEQAPDGTRLDVDVKLGRITIERGNQLRVRLTGNPKIVIEGGETKMLGQIAVESGWVDAQGKKFEVEKGTVTFNGESPPNPVVVVTAGWTAADGTRVYADFVGPVKTGRVTLRSEPPRPKNEILALVLFGTADGANPQPPPPGRQPDGTTQAAVGLGGGLVAQGLTEALDDLAGIQATARIDTTRSSNPRPEVEFQLSPKVSLSFAHVIGTPPITEPDKNLANVEYRFHRNWSLETTFGDRGTALLDAIWQKRY
ncbi:MAG: translocation/assembly module TamB domain-containing protein [Labilithrix sp.]|nr:translocation/assembly module TamB domain-containing protein [Labilithrix sp.]